MIIVLKGICGWIMDLLISILLDKIIEVININVLDSLICVIDVYWGFVNEMELGFRLYVIYYD